MKTTSHLSLLSGLSVALSRSAQHGWARMGDLQASADAETVRRLSRDAVSRGTHVLASVKSVCLQLYSVLSCSARKLVDWASALTAALTPPYLASISIISGGARRMFVLIQTPDVAHGEPDMLRRMHDEASRHLSHALHLLTLFCFVFLIIMLSIPSDASFLMGGTTNRFQGVEVDLTSFLQIVPLVVVVLVIYVAAYIRHLNSYGKVIPSHERLPLSFNKHDWALRLILIFQIYVLPGLVVVYASHYNLLLPGWRLSSFSLLLLLLLFLAAWIISFVRGPSFVTMGIFYLGCASLALLLAFPYLISLSLQGAWPPDLRGEDLRSTDDRPTLDLSGRQLNFLSLGGGQADSVNFSGSSLRYADFGSARGAKFVDANLHGAKFVGADLQGAVFARADLTDVDFTDAVLSRTDFTGGSAPTAKFVDANLRGAIFEGADLTGADLTGANLSGTEFTRGATLSETIFDGAKFVGTRFMDANLSTIVIEQTELRDVRFTNATIADVTFKRARLVNADFTHATLNDIAFEWSEIANPSFAEVTIDGGSFIRVDLSGKLSFRDAELSNVLFVGSSMAEADFSSANGNGIGFLSDRLGFTLYGLDARNSGFRHAKLSESVFRGHPARRGGAYRYVVLDGSDLTWADLAKTELKGVSLKDARLCGTSLEGAVLDRVRLEGARLGGAVLRKARLRNVRLEGASFAYADLRDVSMEGEACEILKASKNLGMACRGEELGCGIPIDGKYCDLHDSSDFFLHIELHEVVQSCADRSKEFFGVE